MELIVGLVLPVTIILVGIFQNKDTNLGDRNSYKEPEIATVEKAFKQESSESKKEEKSVEKQVTQKNETVSNFNHTFPSTAKSNENSRESSSNTEIKIAKVEQKEPFKYNIEIIEGTINHYVSINITPNSDKSIVEIKQKVERLDLISEFVKVKAYISKQPKIYEEFATPPADYKNNTAIIRFPIYKKYQLYQFQYSVKGSFKDPEVTYTK